jgi:hypothetical protein
LTFIGPGTLTATGVDGGAGIGGGYEGTGGGFTIEGSAQISATGGSTSNGGGGGAGLGSGGNTGIHFGGTAIPPALGAGAITIDLSDGAKLLSVTGGTGDNAFGCGDGANIGEGGFCPSSGGASAGNGAGIASFSNPVSTTRAVGSSASFTCSASPTSPNAPVIDYQDWYTDATGALPFSGNATSSGVAANTYTISKVAAGDDGSLYSCLIQADGGAMQPNSGITFYSAAAKLTATTPYNGSPTSAPAIGYGGLLALGLLFTVSAGAWLRGARR